MLKRVRGLLDRGRYAGRGLSRDDLDQTAYVVLVLSWLERFDPERRYDSPSVAVPTIKGKDQASHSKPGMGHPGASQDPGRPVQTKTPA